MIINFKTSLRKIPSPLKLKFWAGSVFPSHKLKYIIYTNKLFITDDKKSLADENGQRNTIIALSTVATYHIEQNVFGDTLFVVDFNKLSQHDIDKKLVSLEDSLESIFNAEFVKLEIKTKSVSYTLKIKESKYEFKHEIEYRKFNPKLEKTIYLSKYHTWDLNSSFASMGIFGSSGSGKSMLAYFIINQTLGITPHKNIFVVDPKNDELAIYAKKYFLLKNIATDFEHTLDIAKYVHNLMNERFEIRKQQGKALQFDHVFLFIDELAALKLDVDKKQYTEFESLIKRLALKGRAANIHLVLICQRPSVESIPADIRDQLKIRILMGDVNNNDTFKMAMGETKDTTTMKTKKIAQGYIRFEGQSIENFEAPNITFNY